MGRETVDRFARLFVIPQANHGLEGRTAALDGDGRSQAVTPIPNTFDKVALLTAWVENGVAPAPSVVATAGPKTMPVCGYPQHPHYVSGPAELAASYRCQR